LKKKGNRWTKTIGKGLTTNIGIAAEKLRDDIRWKKIAKQIAEAITDGTFGMSVSDFKRWIATGKLPKGYAGGGRFSRPGNANENQLARHKGGPITAMGGGDKYSSRVGYAASSMRMPSEVDIRAKVGEFMINKRAHQRFGTDF